MGKVVKTLAVKKKWRNALQEQDRIVKYLVNNTKQTSMNFIVTRPNADGMIWDRPSRKKLAASKSVRAERTREVDDDDCIKRRARLDTYSFLSFQSCVSFHSKSNLVHFQSPILTLLSLHWVPCAWKSSLTRVHT
jgi:hypothetical protein